MNLPKYCFDTHPLIWYFRARKTLSRKAKLILDKSFEGETMAFVPTIVLLEAHGLGLKDKNFSFLEFLKFLSQAQFIIIPLDEDILKHCFELPKEINIHDRIVMSTALFTGSELVTKDRTLRKFFPEETIW